MVSEPGSSHSSESPHAPPILATETGGRLGGADQRWVLALRRSPPFLVRRGNLHAMCGKYDWELSGFSFIPDSRMGHTAGDRPHVSLHMRTTLSVAKTAEEPPTPESSLSPSHKGQRTLSVARLSLGLLLLKGIVSILLHCFLVQNLSLNHPTLTPGLIPSSLHLSRSQGWACACQAHTQCLLLP